MSPLSLSRVDIDDQRLARALTASGAVSDPFLDDEPRLAAEPLVLAPTQARALCAAAESVAEVYAELAWLCARNLLWLDRHMGLTPWQKQMWHASAPAWHGIARADVFMTDAGCVVCELNSDTPSGAAEAVAVNALARPENAALPWTDPNRALPERFLGLVESVLETRTDRPTVGIVYPTEVPEDLALIRLYAGWLQDRGARVLLGSPFNLGVGAGGAATLFGVPCDLIVRHYKTDWWGERQPISKSEPPFADPSPLERPLRALLEASVAGRTTVINPFGAVVTQNKRTYALMWEELHAFSPSARDTIRQRVPFSLRAEMVDPARLRREQRMWVLKSDYGCEGEEVVVGAEVSASAWSAAVNDMLPRRWIVQRRFTPRPERDGRVANFGVYVIAGQAAGFLTRVGHGATTRSARIVPTLVDARAPALGVVGGGRGES